MYAMADRDVHRAGIFVQARRGELGMTQEQLAAKAGVDESRAAGVGQAIENLVGDVCEAEAMPLADAEGIDPSRHYRQQLRIVAVEPERHRGAGVELRLLLRAVEEILDLRGRSDALREWTTIRQPPLLCFTPTDSLLAISLALRLTRELLIGADEAAVACPAPSPTNFARSSSGMTSARCLLASAA